MSRRITRKDGRTCEWGGCTRTATYAVIGWQTAPYGCDVHVGTIARDMGAWHTSVNVVRLPQRGDCVHNGLFADSGPLDRTHYCGQCGQDVPNRDL